MTQSVHIASAASADDLVTVAGLFQAYAATLPVDLAYQAFAAELAGLPGKYAPPHGALLLARDAVPLGCVAIRPLPQAGCCEMKRLYIVPPARGRGVGRALVEAAVMAARDLGHRELRLDTLPGMAAAIALYDRMGFRRIDPYYAPTPEGTVFMALDLTRSGCPAPP